MGREKDGEVSTMQVLRRARCAKRRANNFHRYRKGFNVMATETLMDLYNNHTGNVSDKWSLYIDVYDDLFSKFRHKNINLLEIGIQNGGSIELFSKYFENGNIFLGCDVNDRCRNIRFNDNRINIIIGDANSKNSYENISSISKKFDIIIDDGSHKSSDIIKTFSIYFPLLSDGGVFVIEDLHCSYWQLYEGGLYDPYSAISFLKLLADIVNYENWGVKISRKDFLAEFSEQYGVSFADEDLACINSVEFINSMCVIRKTIKGENKLGKRIIAGKNNVVVGSLGKQEVFNIDETSNVWSVRSDDKIKIKLLADHIKKIESSFSYKLNRLVSRIIFKINSLVKLK